MKPWQMWMARAVAVAVAGLTLTSLGAADAFGGEPVGPAFGSNRVQTAIQDNGGEEDVDDYVAALLDGETLSVSVGASKKSSLVPSLQILDPDGLDRTPTLTSKSGGKKLSFKKLTIDKTGRWTVRIGASDTGRGDYTASFKVGSRKPFTERKRNQTAGEETIPFDGIDGALASITVKFSRKGSPVSVVALTDPTGGDVPSGPSKAADDFELKGTKFTLKKAPLATGDGLYGLTLGVASSSATYDLKIQVKPIDRPKKKAKLPALEPVLAPRGTPLRGVEDVSVELTGVNFGSNDDRPTVLFDGLPGEILTVASDGTSLRVLPPAGIDGSTVAVAVVDAFGQASQRDDYFLYVPPATITAAIDDAGADVVGGSTLGGHVFRLQGTGFTTGQSVRFGTRAAPVPRFVSETELRITSPSALTAGDVFIFVVDEFERSVASAFQYEYKAPPRISDTAESAYDPVVGRDVGGTVVTINGSGFEFVDEVLFDGQVIASTFFSTTQRTFTTPPRTPGNYSLAIRDRVDAVSTGPDFRIKAPPRVDTLQAIGGFVLPGNLLGIGGGTVIRADGANFDSDDTLAFGGAEPLISSASATRIDFFAPATSPGSVDFSVTDVLGDSSTVSGAFTGVGFQDASSTRSPGGGAVDDLGAAAAAVGDLDNDGRADDVVLIGSPAGSVGTRAENARLLTGNGSGVLIDSTSADMPAATLDQNAVGFGGSAVALGDLDGNDTVDIVIAGDGSYNYTTYQYFSGVRVLTNDGSGTFTFSADLSPPATLYYYRPDIYATDEYGDEQYIGGWYLPVSGNSVSAVAIGDLDQDGDDEVVTTSPNSAPLYFYVDPSTVDFSVNPYAVSYYDATNTYVSAFYYGSATRIFENDDDDGLVDRTLQRFGVLGSPNATVAGLRGRDLALGDIDGSNGPDIVVTWDNPISVSLYGTYEERFYGQSYQTAMVATRILTNDGTGFFTDETDAWLPAGAGAEFWQGDAVELVDIVGDTKLDLLILHDRGPSAATSALRILRNDGPGTGFTDVTASTLPALVAGDNFAGTSLLVHDVNRDGNLDIVIGRSQGVADGLGNPARSTRILFGNGAGTFSFGEEFMPSPAVDSGETNILLVGDMAGHDDAVLILGTEATPQNSTNGDKLRPLDWED